VPLTVVMMGSASLYGSAWLVRVLNDLDTARTGLAELAVVQERLRVSRDLHNLRRRLDLSWIFIRPRAANTGWPNIRHVAGCGHLDARRR
jgi:hypothetical protein